MCWLRPHDRSAVTASDQEEPLADCRCPVIARTQLAMLYLVTDPLQLGLELLELLPLAIWARSQHRLTIRESQHFTACRSFRRERAPVFKFLNVLEHDHAGPG